MKKSLMYNFVKNMWREGRVDEAYVRHQVEKGRLTQDECDEILLLPQDWKKENN